MNKRELNKIKILSPDMQLIIKNNWENFSDVKKEIILAKLVKYDEYEQLAIKRAIKNNKLFPIKLRNYIKKKKKEKIYEIECKEKNEELNNIRF